MPDRRALFTCVMLCAGAAQANEPLSVIDWLELVPREAPVAVLNEPAKSDDASVPDVAVLPLDAEEVSGVGLLPREVTGLPLSLWEGSQADRLSTLISALPVTHPLPAAQSLLFMLLLAEANPPEGAPDAFLGHRIHALSARGANDAALELLRLIPGQDRDRLMHHAADLALLRGDTTAVCETLAARPDLATDAALRVYCLAQAGAWDKAVTTLNAATALGDIAPAQAARLLRFLDPELAEELPPMPPPRVAQLTALDYRLLNASGDPLPTGSLPLRFTVNDLSGDAGWRAKLEAAERLVRAGSIGAAQLFAAYGERVPAASGGVWDRARAIQKLDAALSSGDTDRLQTALTSAWDHMQAHGLAAPFSDAYANRISDSLSEPYSDTLNQIILLSAGYERHAGDLTPPRIGPLAFARGLALGAPSAPADPRARALAATWDDATLPPEAQRAANAGRIGEAMLLALGWLADGAEGDLKALTDGLATLRALGLEDSARRAALQVWLDGDTLR